MELSITLIIIIITVLVSFSAMSNQQMQDQLIFHPPSVRNGQWYRFFSCGLIHADIGHLVFNMLALYLFGMGTKIDTELGTTYTGVEYRFIDVFGQSGKLVYLAMYVLALLFSLLPTYAKNINNYSYRSLGASGAVSAVVFAAILFNPLAGIGLFFIPIFIAGFLFGILYLWVSQVMDKRGGDNVNHSAHIWGALFGLIFTIVACQLIMKYPVLDNFIQQVKSARLKDLIQFGG
jgi:membrane associated rhomboid family serine protease